MARPKCQRRIRGEPAAYYFKPRGIPLTSLEEIVLARDEMEAVRLADLESLYHETAALRMGISRATFGRILDSAREKIAGALVRGHALRLEGRQVEAPKIRTFVCNACGYKWELPHGTGRPGSCPECKSEDFERSEGTRIRGQDVGGIHRRRRHHPRVPLHETANRMRTRKTI